MSVPQRACPICQRTRTQEMGQSSENPSSVMRCEACGHVWMPDSPPSTLTARICAKCGGVCMRVLGWSTGGVRYVRCDECEHLTVEPPPTAGA